MVPPANPTHGDIFVLIAEVRQQIEGLSDRIGHEMTDAEGKVSGTGLTGRMIRTEARVLAYDRLKERAIGGLASASVLIAVLWWITKDKWAALFGVHP